MLQQFAAQQYGIWSKPNMMDVHKAHYSFWSPQPFFIGAFFSMQQIFQLWWIYRLNKLDSKKPSERRELDSMVDYAPIFSLGNIMIALWMVFWNSEQLKISNVCVIINSFAQLYYVFAKLEPMNTNSLTSILNNVVARTFAGIGVLDLVHNGSIAYFQDEPATTTVKVVTAVLFGLLSASSDWIFGSCMVYDLLGIAVGQSGSWRNLLGVYALGSAAIVGVKNLAR